MEISKITNHDGLACANLIKFLTKGRWDLSGEEAEVLMMTKKWVHDLALQMAAQLKSSKSPTSVTSTSPSSGGFKVKAMGPILGGSSNTRKKNRKK